jgi:hypothetical protein
MSIFFGSQVSAVFLGGYPVTGTVKAFVPHPDGDIAVIRVSCDIGLYRQGDVIPVPLARLSEVVTS